jgi:hypothetical protein
MRTGSIVAAFCLFHAQPVAAEEDALVWTSLTANGPLGGGFLFTGDAAARIGSAPQHFRQYLVRAAIGAEIGRGVSLHAGYAHFWTGTRQSTRGEHRTWQQLAFPVGDVGRMHLHGRSRLEQRYLPGTDAPSWRVRQQVRGELSLSGKGGPSLLASGEIFMNLNAPRGAPRAGLDRWRAQAGLSIPVGSGMSIQPAYLHQFVPRRGVDLHEHILFTALALRW